MILKRAFTIVEDIYVYSYNISEQCITSKEHSFVHRRGSYKQHLSLFNNTKRGINMQYNLEEKMPGSITTYMTKDCNDNQEIKFIIKENKETILQVGSAPIIDIRGGMVRGDKCIALVMMFKFNDTDVMYDVWFNYNSKLGKEAVKILMNQKKIFFTCADENCNSLYTFSIRNSMAKLARNYSVMSGEYLEWTEQEYHALQNKTYTQCNFERKRLWDALD